MQRIIHTRPLQKGNHASFANISLLKNSARFISSQSQYNGFGTLSSTTICIKPILPKITHCSKFVTTTHKPAPWKNDPNLIEIYEKKSRTNLIAEAAGYYFHRYRNFWFGVIPIVFFLNAGNWLLPVFIFFFSWSNKTRIRITQILFDRSEQKILLFRPGFDNQLNTGHVLVAEFEASALQQSSTLQFNFFININPPAVQKKLYLHPLELNVGKKTTVYEIKDQPVLIQRLREKLEQYGVLPGDWF